MDSWIVSSFGASLHKAMGNAFVSDLYICVFTFLLGKDWSVFNFVRKFHISF